MRLPTKCPALHRRRRRPACTAPGEEAMSPAPAVAKEEEEEEWEEEKEEKEEEKEIGEKEGG